MARVFKDEGIVLTKKKLRGDHQLITIFSKNHGRIVLLGFGVRKITSKRLSHLETGNYIKFSFYKKDINLYLQETEIIYGYSRIKKSAEKINFLFLLFFIMNKVLPQNQSEIPIFKKTLDWLKDLNNKADFDFNNMRFFLTDLLVMMGFINKEKLNNVHFDPISFVEGLISQKIRREFT